MGASKLGAEEEGFAKVDLGPGKRLFLRQSFRFVNQRVDLYWRRPWRPGDSTRLAMLARLLDRAGGGGAQERFKRLDWLYGADLSVEAQLNGGVQMLHLAAECLAPPHLDSQEDLLPALLETIAETLATPQGGFDAAAVQREKTSLRQAQAAEWHDKGSYAYRRCLAEVLGGRAENLSPEGVPNELETINGNELDAFWRNWAAEAEMDAFVSAPGTVPANWVDRLGQITPAHKGLVEPAVSAHGPLKRVSETCEAPQSRLVLAYMAGAGGVAPEEYPVWAVFNALWGGDGNARLFRLLREEHGLCYHVASFIERRPAALMVECALDGDSFGRATELIEIDLQTLRREGPGADEIEAAKQNLAHQLMAVEDSLEGMARFCLQRQSGSMPLPRAALGQAVERVDTEALRLFARRLAVAMVFRLRGSGTVGGER